MKASPEAPADAFISAACYHKYTLLIPHSVALRIQKHTPKIRLKRWHLAAPDLP